MVQAALNDRPVAVVGGGPAGLAAAEILARAGAPVTVYERMPSLGRKFLMAGRGGLNLTHSEPLPAFLDRYHPARSLDAAVRAFPPEAMREWCAGLGQATFVGSSGRVFPESFKASPLLRAWLARLAGLGVAIRPRHRLTGLGPDGLTFDGPEGPLTVQPAATLLALGGASWPRLGSDGAWVPLLEGLGLRISPLRPANAGVTVHWSDVVRERHAGAPLKRVALTLHDETVRGEAIVTQTGLEGGAVYALSRRLRETVAAEGSAPLVIDLRPDLGGDALAGRLRKARAGDSLSARLRKAAGLSPVAIAILRDSEGGSLPPDPDDLARRIKAATVRVTGTMGLDRAISTAGGVEMAALDEHGMVRSRPGLFLAGEMLDWEAPTGGYLLQGVISGGRATAGGMLRWLGADQGLVQKATMPLASVGQDAASSP